MNTELHRKIPKLFNDVFGCPNVLTSFTLYVFTVAAASFVSYFLGADNKKTRRGRLRR